MKHFSKYAIVALAISLFSCDSSSDVKAPDLGTDYFPMRVGQYQIYDVNEIIYTLGDPDTFVYQLKTIVIDSFLNSESTYTYVIHRSVRNSSSEPWTYKDTWSSRMVNDHAIEAEENIDFVKLIFPFQVGIKWNGNAYNNLGDEDYELESIQSQTVNNVTFTDCLNIKQQDNQDFIVYLDQRYETYAKNVGLIHRKKTQLTYCSDADLGCIGKQIVDEGVIYEQTILQHGME